MRVRTIVAFAFGPISAAALGAITLPLTAWVFAREDIGRLNMLQTLVALVINALFLGLDNAFAREYFESPNRALLYSTSMTPPVVLLVLLSIPIVLAPTEISRILYGLDSPFYAYATIGAVYLSLIIRQWSLLARMQERANIFSLSQLIPKLVQVLGVVGFLAFAGNTSFAILVSIFLSSLVAGTLFIGLATIKERPMNYAFRVDPTLLRKLVMYGLPAMVAAFAYVAMASTGVFTVRYFLDFEELGVYSIALSIGAVIGIIQFVFNTVWGPILYRAKAENRAELVLSRAFSLMPLIFGVVIAGVGALSWVIPFFLPVDYASVSYLVVGAAFLPLAMMMRDVGAIGIAVKRRTTLSALTATLSFLAGLVLSLILVPLFGIAGALSATIIASWLLFVASTEIACRIWFAPRRFGMHFVVGSASSISIVTLMMGKEDFDGYAWLWLAYGLIVLYSYRGQLSWLSQLWRQRGGGGTSVPD